MRDPVVVAAFAFVAGLMIGVGFIKASDSYDWSGRYVLMEADEDKATLNSPALQLVNSTPRAEFDRIVNTPTLRNIAPWPLPRRFRIIFERRP